MGILTSGVEYNSRYYGNFRGVDFSSDHTQVNPSRLAYLVNMYKDYRSKQGNALETIAGFRQRVVLPNEDGAAPKVFGIFNFEHKVAGVKTSKYLIHAGSKLWLWNNYPYSININKTNTVILTTPTVADSLKTFVVTLSFPCSQVISLTTSDGIELTNANGSEVMVANTFKYLAETHELTIVSDGNDVIASGNADLSSGSILTIVYKENVLLSSDTPLFSTMNKAKSSSFVFDNRLYILDGQNYLVYDGTSVSAVSNNAYIPTTYINAIPGGDNKSIGTQYEQRNFAQPKFRQTFVGDGTTTVYELNDTGLGDYIEVMVNNVLLDSSNYAFDKTAGTVTFTTAPAAPTIEGSANVKIIVEKPLNVIEKCTLCTTFDGRVFLTGNPDYPNNIYFCGINKDTGLIDPTYFGILNYQQDGVGIAPITGIMGVSDTLMVLKADTQQDSAVYFHKGEDTSDNIIPRIYPSVQGLSGLGCVGACINFRDDPIFISKLGVEAMAQLSVRLERATEHRSSLIDAKLINSDIHNALLEEYAGYLCLIIDGDMYLADSRQAYADETGVKQYEWYYISGLGVYDGQYKEFYYADSFPEYLENKNISATIDGVVHTLALTIVPENYFEGKDDRIANPPLNNGTSSKTIYHNDLPIELSDGTQFIEPVDFVISEIHDITDDSIIEYKAYYTKSQGNFTGGTFYKTSAVKNMNENLFFGTENGVVCSFNFDKRDSQGEIPSQYYNFDGRTIFSGCATLMDNCGIPHLTKTTLRGSTVIKTKSFLQSAAKVKVRTNKSAYEQITRINNSIFSFDALDFSEMTFNTDSQTLYAVNEKEKKWVEKQYFIFSNEYCKPFALLYLAYRYRIIGRFK